MIKSVDSLGKLIATSILVVVVLFAAAEEGKGEKEGDKEKNGVSASQDSLDQSLDLGGASQVDDTLVFEDWELPGEGDKGDGDYNQTDEEEIKEEYDLADQSIAVMYKKAEEQKSTTTDSKVEERIRPVRDEQFALKSAFTVYPNPALHTLHLRVEDIPQTVVIRDIQGRVYSTEPYLSRIDISGLTSGTYFIRLIYADRPVQSRKFIKS